MKKEKKFKDAYIDQHNNVFYARTRKELHDQIPGKVQLMYCDNKNGTVSKVGYVIGYHWLTKYSPVELK
jgi:hypothetical protein